MDLDCPTRDKASCGGPETSCRRCGCDLCRMRAIAKSASGHLAAAPRCLRECDWTPALRHAERSWRLRHSELAARLAFLASAALGDTGRATRWHAASARSPQGWDRPPGVVSASAPPAQKHAPFIDGNNFAVPSRWKQRGPTNRNGGVIFQGQGCSADFRACRVCPDPPGRNCICLCSNNVV